MIERYSRPEMVRLWSADHRYSLWLKIETLACEAWAREGLVPRRDLAAIQRRGQFRAAEIQRLEAKTQHDVVAFVTAVARRIGKAGRHLHRGLTSSDILDTAFSVQLMESTDMILMDLGALLKQLRFMARRYAALPQVGRTHGIHAEPITFGLKVAGWAAALARDKVRIKSAREGIRYGKIAGAVGTYAHLNPAIERFVLGRMGLKAEPVATQIVPRDRYGALFTSMALLAANVERVATEIRHLQRTEVGEVEEPFGHGQTGSSAMPHKKNPILSENITGLARLVRSYAVTALENIVLWHERDISHSSVERVIGPDVMIICDFMLHRLLGILKGLVVHGDRMMENLQKTHGLIFSEGLLLALVDKGLKREKAYAIVQRLALKAQAARSDFKSLVVHDHEVRRTLSPAAIETIFNLKHVLRFVPQIIKRGLQP